MPIWQVAYIRKIILQTRMKENTDPIIVYYKPGCSKCRTALTALEEANVTCDLVEYLVHPLSKDDIKEVLKKLGVKAKDIVRTSEPLYSEKFANKTLSNAQWIAALAKYPVLMQRPIVVQGQKAWIARSPEEIEKIINY